MLCWFQWYLSQVQPGFHQPSKTGPAGSCQPGEMFIVICSLISIAQNTCKNITKDVKKINAKKNFKTAKNLSSQSFGKKEPKYKRNTKKV
jgi:hypothetical protein